MYQKLIDYFEKPKILILGFGREGRSSFDFIRKHYPKKLLTVADLKALDPVDEFTKVIWGEKYLDALADFDLIIKSPGIPFRGVKIPLGPEISCQNDLFLRFVDRPVIGVTGTKGKSTTSSLIYEMLKAAGIDACLIGNIGVPVFESLDDLAEKTAVVEMSSHQLEFTKASPHIAVFTNIHSEHLDHYEGGFEGYLGAKINIGRFQGSEDYFVYDKTSGSNIVSKIDFDELPAQKLPVDIDECGKDEFLKSLLGQNPRLLGKHNFTDICLAAKAAGLMGVGNEAIYEAVINFKGIEHRMEPVGTFRRISFYDDAIATVPKAVMAAVEALDDVRSLIIGGKDRGLDYSEFVEDLTKSKIKNLICLPETGYAIGEAVERSENDIKVFIAQDMEAAVRAAYRMTPPGFACLLSPAAASYNCYKDFAHKGDHFRKLVLEYGKA